MVTGAAGGVGSVAIPLLAQRRLPGGGVERPRGAGRLPEGAGCRRGGGSPAQLAEGSKAPLDSARWAGAVDAVGGDTLVNLLKAMQYHGVVAACGLAGGAELHGTVFPFILRGVRLIGINSASITASGRAAVWARIARDLDLGLLARMTTRVPLSDVPKLAPDFLRGAVRGRLVVDTQRLRRAAALPVPHCVMRSLCYGSALGEGLWPDVTGRLATTFEAGPWPGPGRDERGPSAARLPRPKLADRAGLSELACPPGCRDRPGGRCGIGP